MPRGLPVTGSNTFMSAAPKSARHGLLKRVSQGVAAFFTHDVEIQRADDGVKLVLQPTPAAKGPAREQEAARLAKQELALMRQQLAELLDELPETRQTLRHLVFVEHAIRKHGLKALHKLPVDVMERALSQFEGLVTNWSPVGLASLRSKMAVAIIDRDHRNAASDDEVYRTAAVMDTLPPAPADEAPDTTDDEALAAAYAALGNLAPGAVTVEMQGELNSPSARVLEREATRPVVRSGTAADSIQLRELQH
ncbi:MAG: hypothetical protein Q7U73_21100 [Rubrivivax sp.]|nr:hypothetical protein [Rubrivivax sp.]